MSVKIISLNVNGIRNSKKRTAIFSWINDNKADIVFLQETHCNSDQDKIQWSSEWGGKCIWSTSSSSSCGVAILFKPNIDVTLSNSEIDIHGRYIIVDCQVDEVYFHLTNIYAPNSPTDHESFFVMVNKKL